MPHETLLDHLLEIPSCALISTGRTGTDFLQSLLDSHPEVLTFNGTLFFYSFWDNSVCVKAKNFNINEVIAYWSQSILIHNAKLLQYCTELVNNKRHGIDFGFVIEAKVAVTKAARDFFERHFESEELSFFKDIGHNIMGDEFPDYLQISREYGEEDFQNKQKLATEILIYTKDKPGLLYKLSGAVTVSGFNVVEAKVSTLNNGMALDILWVRDLNGLMLDKLYHFPKLEKKMFEILSNDNLLEKEIKNEKEKNLKKNLFNINTKIFIDNDSSKKHTILEINTFDRIGLIYDVTKKLYELGLKISSAKILTMGKGASEIFYIQDFRGNKILSNKKINKLKTSITTLLNN